MTILGRIHDWLQRRYGVDEVVGNELTGYLLSPRTNRWYTLGSVLLFAFALQVVTGMLLLVYYKPDAQLAFQSVTTIMNTIPYGWLVRYCHAVGANLMIIALLLHMLSVLVMGSYKSPRELNWLSGFTLFLVVQGVALTGYLLPWSQLSFWATTVATNSGHAIPLIGDYLVEFLRGGRVVGDPTLTRFYALHVAVLPTAVAALVALHLFLLKRTGISTPPHNRQPTVNPWPGDRYTREDHPGGIPFVPNFICHDLTSISLYLAILLTIVSFAPNLFSGSEALIPANPFVTPKHIKPDWHFLANYQALKLFPGEASGIFAQLAVVAGIALLPFWDRGAERNPRRRPLFLALVGTSMLGWIALTIWGHLS